MEKANKKWPFTAFSEALRKQQHATRQHHTSQKLASIMSVAFGGKKAKNDNLGYLILQWGKEKDKML